MFHGQIGVEGRLELAALGFALLCTWYETHLEAPNDTGSRVKRYTKAVWEVNDWFDSWCGSMQDIGRRRVASALPGEGDGMKSIGRGAR